MVAVVSSLERLVGFRSTTEGFQGAGFANLLSGSVLLSWDRDESEIIDPAERTETMNCSQCGVPLPPDVGFCRACGAFVRPRSATPIALTPENPPEGQTVVASPAWLAAPTSPQGPSSSPAATWTPPGAILRAGSYGRPAPPSTLGDVMAAVGAGFVLISLFLTWYSVTLSALGVQFYESLEQAFLSRLFPQIAGVRVIPQPCVQVIHHRAPGILSSSFHLPPASAAFR